MSSSPKSLKCKYEDYCCREAHDQTPVVMFIPHLQQEDKNSLSSHLNTVKIEPCGAPLPEANIHVLKSPLRAVC